ncbi:MAG: RNA polymerase sigma factor [Clostridiales bacterium]|nr:RNA polymerase sigma factor [Clostridiales bacterium]
MTETALCTDADFESFYERHWKYVYRLSFTYLRNVEDAEDCTEDVFVKVLTGNNAFQDEIHERKWLTVTTINLCKDRLKSFSHKNVRSLDDDTFPEPASSEKEDQSEILEAVMDLPIHLKDVVLLFYFDGYKTDEIAEMLSRPSSTVRNQLSDARKALKKKLGDILW